MWRGEREAEGRERERKEKKRKRRGDGPGGQDLERERGIERVCGRLGGATKREILRDMIINYSTGPRLHPGSLAVHPHPGPDHPPLRPIVHLWPFPFSDATPLSLTHPPISLSLSLPLHPHPSFFMRALASGSRHHPPFFLPHLILYFTPFAPTSPSPHPNRDAQCVSLA